MSCTAKLEGKKRNILAVLPFIWELAEHQSAHVRWWLIPSASLVFFFFLSSSTYSSLAKLLFAWVFLSWHPSSLAFLLFLFSSFTEEGGKWAEGSVVFSWPLKLTNNKDLRALCRFSTVGKHFLELMNLPDIFTDFSVRKDARLFSEHFNTLLFC